VSGVVSADNSLIGSDPGDRVGFITADLHSFTVLSNGNYVVKSPYWNGNRGAATWGSGTSGVVGVVSSDNSLIGSDPNDFVGFYIAVLSNDNYVVENSVWNGGRGAATWGSGTTGVSGVVSAANSFIGSDPSDDVGFVAPLSNGNYVVGSPSWNGNRGAVTLGNGTTGVVGLISAANSLIGSNPGDAVGSGITALSNGNYVVESRFGGLGAATFGNGTAGLVGVVSADNSLVGSNPGDAVGFVIIPLSTGNYVVESPHWNGNRAAVTWGSGTTGVSGPVSADNSLVGSNPGDAVGFVFPLSTGNYVVLSPHWNGNRGAVTWGTAGVVGPISAANSLIGSNPGDQVGSFVQALSNGNYVVESPNWNGSRGAATWGSGTTGLSGVVSVDNSLIGSNPNDSVGFVTPLSNGNYVVDSYRWNGARGAATWGNGTAGVVGVVSADNSLIGSNPGDQVGYLGVIPLSNGNYVVESITWNSSRGAATWGNGTTGVVGVVSAANSLTGSNPGDARGGVFPLSNGNYLVGSANWNGGRGAVTWVDGNSGRTADGSSVINSGNSLLGQTPPTSFPGLPVTDDPVHQAFIVLFPPDDRLVSGFPDPNQLTFARAQDRTITITPTLLTSTLNTGTAVVLQASNDITINSPITISAGGSGGALTLQAGRSILVNASISTDNGDLTLIANDTLASGVVDAQRDPGNAVIMMAPGTTLDTGSGSLTVELRDGNGRTNTDSGAITLQSVTAGSMSVVNNGPSAGSDVVLGTVSTLGTQSYANPNGTTTLTGNLTATDSAVTFNNAVKLTAGLTIDAGAGTVTFAGGPVAPDLGLVTIVGGVAFSGSATFTATLAGTDPASYSQVEATGPVDLGGSTLNLVLGFTPLVGDSFTLLSSDSGPISGTFAGLDEGASFSQDGLTFQITYQGGPGGNSVVLTRLA
jgi:hypothetical protein